MSPIANSGTPAMLSNAAPAGTSSPPPHTTISVSQVQENIAQEAKPKATFWTVEFYKEYFNVDSSEVGRRLLASIVPTSYFFDLMGSNPDLYGPFWIATTVTSVAFISNAIGKYIKDKMQDNDFTYNTQMLSICASVCYSFVTFCPLLIWGLMKWFSFKPKLLEIVCIYGYSLTVWIPLLIICIAPLDGIEWICAIIGLVISGIFSFRNYYPYFASGNESPDIISSLRTRNLSKGTIIMLFILGSQLAFAILFLVVLAKK